MKTIEILTQEEFDALPEKFDEFTCIQIKSGIEVWIEVKRNFSDSAHVRASGSAQVEASDSAQVRAYGSAQVTAYGSAQVRAYDSAHVRASGSAQVEASDSAQVRAYGSAQVEASGSAHVRASGSAQVEASGSAQVEASDSAKVTAYGSAQVTASGSAQVTASGSAQVEASDSAHVRASGSAKVTAYGSAQVRAYGSAQVRAYGSAQVEAYDSAKVYAWGNTVLSIHSDIKIEIHQQVVAVCIGCNPIIVEQDETAQAIKVPVALHDQRSFLGVNKGNIQEDGRVLLYKMTRKDSTDHYTGKIKYGGIVECPDWDPDPERECGGGLHLSPTEFLAKSYHPSGTLKRCLVHPDDFVVWPRGIDKVRCRTVEVIR